MGRLRELRGAIPGGAKGRLNIGRALGFLACFKEESAEVQRQSFRHSHESARQFQFRSSVEGVQRAQRQAAAEDLLSVEARKTKQHFILWLAKIDKLLIYMRSAAIEYEKAFLTRRNKLSAVWLVDTP